MRALIFDTETTGKVNWRAAVDDPTQPDIVQLAVQVVDTDNLSILNEINLIVQPGQPISPEAEKIHGISQSLIQAVGINRRKALSLFHDLMRAAEVVVAHNYAFDSFLIRRAYFMEEVSDREFAVKPHFCTMQASTNVLKLPGKFGKGYKWPTLQEAYRFLVDENGFEGAHNAMVDVEACLQVYMALLKIQAERASA